MSKESQSQGRKRRLFSSSVSSDPKVQAKKSCQTHTGGTGDSVRLSKGQSVFVYSEEEAWKEAVVLDIDCSQSVVTVTMEDSAQVTNFSMDEVYLYWENKAEEVNNLTNIHHVHEANVLSCLQKRFEAGLYYTYAGNTVVAVNPYTDVGHLYTLETIQAYHHREQGLPPHIYTVAESSHMNLVRELGQINQSIVISGESGAGKTVSAKHLLRYLTIVANPAAEKCCLDDKGFQIEQRVVDSNPVLEAFGNAATTRNDNSSRFGKFIELQFSRAGQIQGGSIQTYLLEKTRVMHQGQGENNFHVFYQMTRMTAEEENYPEWIRELRNEVADTAFLCVPHNQDCSENAELRDTLDAMGRIGLCGDSQRDVFQVLLAILYLGNLSFVNVDDDDSSSLEGSPRSSGQSDCQDDSFVEVSVCGQALERSSQLLGLNPDLLRQTLLHRSLQAGGGQRRSVFIKPIGIAEARSRRDILAMLLYSKLFEWLVEFINSRIKAEVFDNVIGLLDIYGFEIFPSNSLEQLCINYANERLQQHYVAHFLKNLQREYQEECLPWVPIDYNDNRPCLELLDGRFGVFSLLNEEVYLNRKSDVEGLRDRLLKVGGQLDNCLRSPRLSANRHPSFVVQHYAGDVHYTVSHLVPKNKDDIPADHISLLTSSQNPFVKRLFASYVEPESPTGRKKKTVLTKFKSSLDNLMSSIEQSDVHYIRCLRPNDSNAPGLFQGPYVLQQLRACGTIESVNICRKGFPARMAYWEFLQRYSLILRSQYCVLADSGDGVDGDDDDDDDEEDKAEDVRDPQDMLMPPKVDFCAVSPNAMPAPRKKARRRIGLTQREHDLEVCQAILERSTSHTHSQHLKRQFGRSKLFLTEQQLEELECVRLTVLHHSATCLQSAWRALCCRRRHRRLVAAALTIHRAWAAVQTRRWFLRLRRASVVLQRAWLTFRTRRDFLVMKQATLVVQRAWVSVLARRRFLLLRRSAIVIQQAWRTFQTRTGFVRLKHAAVVVQRRWRTCRVRREFLGWKLAAVAIQRAWQTRQTRRQFLELKKATTVLQKGARQWLHKRQQQPPTTEEAEDVTLTWPPLTPTEVSPADHSVLCSLEQAISDGVDGSEACDDNCSVDSGVMLHELVPEQLVKETGKGVAAEVVVGRQGEKGRERDRGERCERRCCLSATSVAAWACLRGFHVGDGVVSRHRIVKGGVRFHTRASVLQYGHVRNRWYLPQGLSDILRDLSYGGQEMGCPVD